MTRGSVISPPPSFAESTMLGKRPYMLGNKNQVHMFTDEGRFAAFYFYRRLRVGNH
jgi:hypothetical protein